MEDTKKTQAKKTKGTITGSEEARKATAVVLEVISGSRGTQSATEVLGISLMKYYMMEERALQGMVTALEPRPRGRRAPRPEDELARAEKERERLKREVGRMQTLLRLVRKSAKLQDPVIVKKGHGKRPRKVVGRVDKMLARLRPAAGAAVVTAAEVTG